MSKEAVISNGQPPSRHQTSSVSPPCPNLSVLIICLNEEGSLRRCLLSLPKSIEIVVVDSGSQDGSVSICREFGATVFTRPFDNYSSQKNYGLERVTRPWVLCIDADEELSPELCKAVVGACSGADTSKCYRLHRRLFFQGQLLRYGKTADSPLRLFPRGSATFHGTIHEELKPQGKEETTLQVGFVIHRSYRDLTDYFTKFNKYTTRVAERHLQEGRRSPGLAFLMLRPLTDFVSRYLFRLGFLDGYAGFAYALISSTYAFVKYAKLVELTKPQRV